jgi:hypothetical protein
LAVDASVIQVGAGAGLSPATSLDSTGSRLNIDKAIHPDLTAGVAYDVVSFQYKASGNVGNVQPFLARSTGASTYEVLWVGPTIASPESGGIVTISYDLGTQQLTPAQAADVYAGFNAATNTIYHGAGTTDHNNPAIFGISPGGNIG